MISAILLGKYAKPIGAGLVFIGFVVAVYLVGYNRALIQCEKVKTDFIAATAEVNEQIAEEVEKDTEENNEATVDDSNVNRLLREENDRLKRNSRNVNPADCRASDRDLVTINA